MKIKCIQLLNADGQEIESSPWLKLGRIYHVMRIHVALDGTRRFTIISHHPKGEWPQWGSHQTECFEIVSEAIPSNWRTVVYQGTTDIAPSAWQESGFYEAFSDHDPVAYPIFVRERDIILSEDP
ncbi:hypothetical protein ABIC94_004843 [Variovorax paradoxus]|uniref:hypothetical protein n=1 Tax=Variovorax paradoxus TaxID=34073 RepID=UPI0033935DDA